ncbi:MAG: MBL fold metallo-hydrolase [Alphaproteobacteria bacterium]|jgi:phosphoribosyl 1,2-cyclic phosphodiesterase|nr:MBL fold metallo-hydrolase [Alphaproteobacteria bacterium]
MAGPGRKGILGDTDDFFVRFWGVRGSIACPGPDTTRYGGNTSCLEVCCGERMLIFDAGTGIHALGSDLKGKRGVGGDFSADLFFSHTHFDHICGFPFFSPAFDESCELRIWAGHLMPERTIREVLIYLMMDPLFPVPMDTMRAHIDFRDFGAGETLAPAPGVSVQTAPLNHPNRATGYRIDYQGHSICYVTDTEHVPDKPDRNILELVDGADIFIYDCTYTDEEFKNHLDWGHSTWQEGARLAEAANVGTLVVFHHDPDHDDAFMDQVASDLEAVRPGSIVAREGMVLRP